MPRMLSPKTRNYEISPSIQARWVDLLSSPIWQWWRRVQRRELHFRRRLSFRRRSMISLSNKQQQLSIKNKSFINFQKMEKLDELSTIEQFFADIVPELAWHLVFSRSRSWYKQINYFWLVGWRNQFDFIFRRLRFCLSLAPFRKLCTVLKKILIIGDRFPGLALSVGMKWAWLSGWKNFLCGSFIGKEYPTIFQDSFLYCLG